MYYDDCSIETFTNKYRVDNAVLHKKNLGKHILTEIFIEGVTVPHL